MFEKYVEQKKVNIFVYYLVIILFLEIVYKINISENGFFNIGLIYMPLFSIAISFLLTFITRFFKDSVNRVLVWVFTILLCLIFGFQYIFVTLLSVPFSLHSLGLANQAVDFYEIVIKTIFRHILVIILILLPIILLVFARKKVNYGQLDRKSKIKYLLLFATVHIIAILFLFPNKSKVYSPYKIYYNLDMSNTTNSYFGLLTGMRIDIKRVIFKSDDYIIDVVNSNIVENTTPTEYGYNISDIDFAALRDETNDSTLSQMHNYFANEQPTRQNEYTGIFKDKNLIFIVAEGFSGLAIDKELTPTLYKLSTNSFVFENYYTPTMFSTVGGEMQALLGLLPFQETVNSWPKQQQIFPYAIGNSFQKEGYTAKAYHNWTYTYYNRDKTRPTIGFSDYLGKGNGLEKLMDCSTWPTSDLDLIEAIGDQIIGQDEKMVTYILTVSGHANYNWTGNYISYKNKDLADDLPYSEPVQAYLATQIELDKALELLIAKLEEAGELEDTVIALVADHYPYFFTVDEMNELSSYKRDKVEIQQNTFILYNSAMPKTVINKTACQIDVLPTLLNLFAIPYDSRLIIGKDILSDTPGLVMFSEYSWITDLGRYDNGTFTPKEGAEIPEGYVDTMSQIVANKFLISKLIFTKDYYREVLK